MNPPQPIPTPELAASLRRLRAGMERDVLGNVLPFWIEQVVDPQTGGFYSAVTNDLHKSHDEPRSAVVVARILWTYAAAFRLFARPEYLVMAQRALRDLNEAFRDRTYGGVYWRVDAQGRPVSDRKQSYAQAFAIYGLSEYHRATGDAASLLQARDVYDALETWTRDAEHGGYVEGCARDWGTLEDMRLSDKEPNCRKSMNTLLHILEAYTSLLRVWNDTTLRSRLRNLVGLFLDRIIDPGSHHFRLFFDDRWQCDAPEVSFGHDIEGSWLLVEAAEALGDPALLARVREASARMAQAVYDEGRDVDGSLLYEGNTDQPGRADKHWWAQAEAIVGFYNAYQLTGEERFARAAVAVWTGVEERFIDRVHGDWFKVLDRAGVPRPGQLKVGPWECPYHHSRASFEMLARLPA